MSNPPDSRPSSIGIINIINDGASIWLTTFFRDGEVSVDLYGIMLMEAIWLSMQETSVSISDDYITSEHDFGCDVPYITQTPPPASFSVGGLASAIASIVEHQQTGGRECSTSYDNNTLSLTRLPTHSLIHCTQSLSIGQYHEFHCKPHDSRSSFEYLTEHEENEVGFRSISGSIISPEFQRADDTGNDMSLAQAYAPLPIHRHVIPLSDSS